MIDREACPECGEPWTDRQHISWHVEGVTEVRTCDSCSIEYENRFVNPVQEVTRRSEEEHDK